ncbi:type I pantothenate kinase [Streptococcus loxodontisalivarius]|uniref:Pantothenate kinase n=1 Tax=Streptococcus loxodontisalivarius TaxID=1349415 RepID=A0ABS2PQT1_9STRE|nr:type I pantothenate kinase [Streptococcus loxodontisalivarius]MBM7641854.1 type I pantothenate kinase [Streptococcus loxodontisalivarius]
MLNEFINFQEISRQTWQRLHQESKPLLTSQELDSLKSLNDKISIQDVTDIYLPLINLIRIYKKSIEDLAFSKSIFLQKNDYKRPFIIGVSGSVAVGKSTTSRLIQLLLQRIFKDATVELVTTDGFLYPNQVLKDNGILHRKGFPESYDMPLLLNFLDTVKNGSAAKIPIYSHEIYNIVPDQFQTIPQADFIIVEGINVFQTPQNERLYVNDYFDFSIYIDAEVENIEHWYLERFEKLLNLAQYDSSNHYHQFTQMPRTEALAIGKNTWKTINLINLETYIEPTRNRADVILHKAHDHKIDYILLKK